MAEKDAGDSPTDTITARFMVSNVVRTTLFALPVYVVGSASRPLWRGFMRMLIAKGEKRQDQKTGTLSFNRISLIYEARGPWESVVPYLDDLNFAKLTTRMQLTHSFALLYLHNRRLEEALKAARDWVSTSEKYVAGNVQDPRKIVRLYQKLPGWYLRPEQRIKPVFWTEKSSQVLNKIHRLSKGVVKQNRDARVALSLLLWVQNQGLGDAFNLISKRNEINPFIPSPKGFDHELAVRLGMTNEDFDRICAAAERYEPERTT